MKGFLRVLHATCDDALQNVLENELPNVKVVDVRYPEHLEEVLSNDTNFHALILKETFAMNTHPGLLIKKIRESYPNIRIIFIMTTTNSDDIESLKTYLYSKQVYDIIYDNDFGMDHLIAALFQPKTQEDILNETKKMSFDDEFNNVNKMNNLMSNPSELASLKEVNTVTVNYNNNISYEYPSTKVISFWSPKGGTGVDTLAINTALFLAKNTNVEVCIADFAETPNLHLHLNVIDNVKNLEVLYAQQIMGKLNPYSVDDYVINSADTHIKIPNLHIVPGAIKKISFFRAIKEDTSPQEVGKCFESIIDTLREKYTIVILILSSDIKHIPTYAALRKSNQINLVLENNITSFYNANRFLDNEFGMFNFYKISKEKCKVIINKDYVDDNFYIDNFTKITGLPISARVPLMPEEVFNSIKLSNPSLLTELSQEGMAGILSVVNTITPMYYNVPNESTSQKKGLLGGLFGKK